jgi:hypothetical protein
VKSPVHYLQVVSALMENGTRMGEFIKAYEFEVKKGAGEVEASQRASLAAREISTDYARHGSKTAALRAAATFWNAGLQGDARTWRQFSDPKTRRAAVVKSLVAITLPSLIFAALNADDPEYEEIPQWQRDLFWLVKIPIEMTPDLLTQGTDSGLAGQWYKPFRKSSEGVWVRLPKPFGLGQIFGSVPERAFEWLKTNDPQAFKETVGNLLPANPAKGGQVGGNALFGGVPDIAAVQPFFENLGNYSRFMNRPIVPRQLESVLDEYQYTDRTSQFAKWATSVGRRVAKYVPGSQSMGLTSPMKFENMFRSWTAGLGGYALALSDLALKDRPAEYGQAPAYELADVPGIKAFIVRNPGFSSESISNFYEEYNRLGRIDATYRMLERDRHKRAEARRFRDRHRIELREYARMASVAERIKSRRERAERAETHPHMSRSDKRKLMQDYGRQAAEIAAEALRKGKARQGL